MMLNEYPASLLPEKLKSMLKVNDIKAINEMDNKITKWYFAKWIALFLTSFILTIAIFINSNVLLLTTFATLYIYFTFKYMERYWEQELLEYLITLQIHLALYKGMTENDSEEEK